MQVKYLSLALAAALAATLTGCGSDSDTNYNKQLVTPENPTNPAPAPTPENPKNPDGKEPTVDNGDNGGKPEDGKKPQTENGELPPSSEYNPGGAANPGNPLDKNIVVMQNYVRGEGSSFDTTNNPKPQDGNATVLGFNDLENQYLSNIVTARALQKNDSGVTTLANLYTGQEDIEVNKNTFGDNGSITFSSDTTSAKNPALQQVNVTELDNGIVEPSSDKTQNSDNEKIYKSGLVRIQANADAGLASSQVTVRGQEDAYFTVTKDGKADLKQGTGNVGLAKGNKVRMFGAHYTAANTVNEVFKNGKWTDTTTKGSSQDIVADNTNVNNDLGTSNYVNSYSLYDLQVNEKLKNSASLTPTQITNTILKPNGIHLDNVQYGRVTVNLDKTAIDGIISTLKANSADSIYSFNHHINLADKKEITDDADVKTFNGGNTNVDYYFARGNRTATDLPKSGKVTYLGHALMHGLDNSFHGGRKAGDDNTVVAKTGTGVGNFVAAQVDFGAKNVKGQIYNIWQTQNSNKAEKDALVNFEGTLNDTTNSVLGKSQLAYGAKDEGSFIGAFYGKNAEEFAGSVNSITQEQQFGTAKWGGVFGAKKAQGAADIGLDIENAVELYAKPAATTAATGSSTPTTK